jgi:hypothetical protein
VLLNSFASYATRHPGCLLNIKPTRQRNGQLSRNTNTNTGSLGTTGRAQQQEPHCVRVLVDDRVGMAVHLAAVTQHGPQLRDLHEPLRERQEGVSVRGGDVLHEVKRSPGGQNAVDF